jgi:hypothetical protein
VVPVRVARHAAHAARHFFFFWLVNSSWLTCQAPFGLLSSTMLVSSVEARTKKPII